MPKKNKGYNTLACVIFHNGEFYIYHPVALEGIDVISKSARLAWLISKPEGNGTPNNEFTVGDYLKFGRVTFKVKETSADPILFFNKLAEKDIDNTSEGGAIIANPPSRYESTNRLMNIRPASSTIYRRKSHDHHNISVIAKDSECKRSNSSLMRSFKSGLKLKKLDIPLLDKSGRASGLKSARVKQTFTCRICLSDASMNEDHSTYDPEDPLISPCQCDGTMKYIHLE